MSKRVRCCRLRDGEFPERSYSKGVVHFEERYGFATTIRDCRCITHSNTSNITTSASATTADTSSSSSRGGRSGRRVSRVEEGGKRRISIHFLRGWRGCSKGRRGRVWGWLETRGLSVAGDGRWHCGAGGECYCRYVASNTGQVGLRRFCDGPTDARG